VTVPKEDSVTESIDQKRPESVIPKGPPIPEVDALALEELQAGLGHRLKVNLLRDGVGRRVQVPVLAIRGARPGPVLGVTAAVHGNELNGVPIIHRLASKLDATRLCGTLVAVPVVNVPGYLENRREYRDGADLNRVMPGKPVGTEAQTYAYRFLTRIVHCFEYLVDLHTASFGRKNSLYVRVDLNDPIAKRMAMLIGAQIIVHNAGEDGTLRAAAAERGVRSITVEVGDPNRFQSGLIRSSRLGLESIMEDLGMLERPDNGDDDHEDAVVCWRSYWLYTDVGGVLQVFPRVTDRVKKGQRIARVTDIYGAEIRSYEAPEDGIVVGTSTNPVAHTGARILHLGIED
jgi:predicted deacylase